MDWTYLLIAAAILILPFVLTKLLSGKSGDASKVMGAYAPQDKPAGAPVASAELTGQVKALMAQDKKIEAVKLVREKTGLGLADAKSLVETIEESGAAGNAGFSFKATLAQAGELNDQVQHLVAQGNKIEAIKLIREKTGLGLKEAKDLVDRMG